MDSSHLSSGDNSNCTSPRYEKVVSDLQNMKGVRLETEINCDDKITSQIIDEKEIKMKERIAQCKNIIESLKLQLHEEKVKLSNEKKIESEQPNTVGYYKANAEMNMEDYSNTSMYTASVDRKLFCDESLIEYEKQLQKYQNTLNMAQNEKKIAIRKQMLAKAFKLKLMEVENQCNVELLRVKQSLQCLEPLQIIASKWKSNAEDNNIYDINNFELMPNFPELRATSGSEINDYKNELDSKNTTENIENGSNGATSE